MDLPGCWEFPVGKIEKDESAEHCLIREISEELNIKISISHALEAVKFEYESFKIILYPFIAVIENGIIAAKEHESIIFCKPNELSAYDFLAADLLIFPQIDSHFKRKAEIWKPLNYLAGCLFFFLSFWEKTYLIMGINYAY